MKRSEYKIGEFLYGIPDSEESAKYNPENQRVFIHNGYKNGDGYGKLIGWNDGEIGRLSPLQTSKSAYFDKSVRISLPKHSYFYAMVKISYYETD